MKKISKIIFCVITLFVIIFTPLVAYKKTANGQSFPKTTPSHKRILTLWNVDTFEGGVGSRGDFLSKVALSFKGDGSLVMVINHTAESAKTAFSSGQIPDMISYGVGVDFVVGHAVELNKTDFSGGEYNGKFYAHAWCRGGYFLISKKPDNQPIERLIVSKNLYNLPYGALNLSGISALGQEFSEPIKAYLKYLDKGNNFLLGTQRDIWRLERRGEEFYSKPLERFSDLVQYLSITTKDKDKLAECKKFLEYMTSDSVQEKITQIGMFPIKFNPYTGKLGEYNLTKTEYTVSPFTKNERLIELVEETSNEKITNDSLLKFKNTLKRLK